MESEGVVINEERITHPVTGGEKGRKRAQLGALDPRSLMQVAEVAGYGAEKYERMNFMRGYEWSLSYDALQRHLHAFWEGENLDPESQLPHVAHAAWHCLALLTFMRLHPRLDDRGVQKTEQKDDLQERMARVKEGLREIWEQAERRSVSRITRFGGSVCLAAVDGKHLIGWDYNKSHVWHARCILCDLDF